VPKYEEELKYLTFVSLIFYGGSWTTLAGILAAVEAFGTEQVVQEAIEVGSIFFSDNVDQDVSPAEIKENLKNIGLQISLMITVVLSPAWSDLCITVAFASKFTHLVPIKHFLKKTLSRPNIDESELDEYFNYVNQDWFNFLAVITCNIISLTLYGCFPGLIIAMYMGYTGVSVLMESAIDRFNFHIPIVWEDGVITRSYWMKNTTQYYAWGFVFVMSVWQAFCGYKGVFLFLSWVIFLHPVVQVYNILVVDSDVTDDIGKYKEE